METSAPTSRPRRAAVVAALVLLAIVLLPLTAFALDVIDENLIFPVHVVLMMIAGAAAWTRAPRVASPESSTGAGMAFGAAIGFGASLTSYALFFMVLSGVGGV